MPILKLDREKCIGCTSCVAVCPKCFEMADDGKSHIKGLSVPASAKGYGEATEELEVKKIECAEAAAEVCPVQCIEVIK